MRLSFDPNGIVAAYREAIFPMYNEHTGQLDWFRPDPRAIIPLDSFHVSRSLAKTMRSHRFRVTFNAAFVSVMEGCADRAEGTWISPEFISVYGDLHRMGKAHSVEVWTGDRLVGGTYGVAIGAAFMGESMFHYETDASKVALASLVDRLRQRQFQLLDTQFLTPHLASMGAVEISARSYMELLKRAVAAKASFL